MEIILISIRQFRDSFLEKPNGQIFVALSLLRETNSEFKKEIEPFWSRMGKLFRSCIAREITAKLNANILLDNIEERRADTVDIFFFLAKDGKYAINTNRKFARAVFLKLKEFILRDKLPSEKEFRVLFPSAPELTKDLKWKSEYRFRPLEQ